MCIFAIQNFLVHWLRYLAIMQQSLLRVDEDETESYDQAGGIEEL